MLFCQDTPSCGESESEHLSRSTAAYSSTKRTDATPKHALHELVQLLRGKVMASLYDADCQARDDSQAVQKRFSSASLVRRMTRYGETH